MMFLWQRLVFDIPRGGDGGGGGGEGGGGDPMGGPGAGYGGDAGSNFSASDSSGTADMGGGPGTTGGVSGAEGYGGATGADMSYGDAVNEAAANIAGTSGGPEGAMANAAATGNADVAAAVAGMVGGDAGRSASSMGASEGASVSPSTTSTSPSVSPGVSPSVSAGVSPGVSLGYGGFTSADVSQGLSSVGVAGLGAPGISGGLGSLGGLGTSSGVPGVSGVTGVGGLSGVAELGDTGPQGFAATESGFAPSSSAPDVSSGMSAIGLAASESSYLGDMGNVSSLAQAAATPAEGLSDIGIADPTGMSTGFTGMGTGVVGIGPSVDAAVQSLSSFGAQNIGAYGAYGPAASMGPTAVGTPVGTSVGSSVSPSVSPATSPTAFSGMSAQDLGAQLGAMSQPSAQSVSGSPSISSTGFSGANVSGGLGALGVGGPATSAPSSSVASPSVSSESSLAQAASGRSSSSATVESFNDPLTGAPVSVTSIDGVPSSYSVGSSPPSGIAGLLGSPAVSTVANTALSLGIPGYGLANLGVMGLTGTSIYGQGVSLATGQGLQTGGGLIGLAGNANFGQGAGPIGTASGGESGGGGAGGEGLSPTAEIPTPQYTPVESQISDAPVQAIPYNLANFGPTPMPGYRVVPTPSPAFYGNTLTKPQLPPAAYFTPQGYPTNPPIPAFYSDYVTREAYRGQVPPYNV